MYSDHIQTQQHFPSNPQISLLISWLFLFLPHSLVNKCLSTGLVTIILLYYFEDYRRHFCHCYLILHLLNPPFLIPLIVSMLRAEICFSKANGSLCNSELCRCLSWGQYIKTNFTAECKGCMRRNCGRQHRSTNTEQHVWKCLCFLQLTSQVMWVFRCGVRYSNKPWDTGTTVAKVPVFFHLQFCTVHL